MNASNAGASWKERREAMGKTIDDVSSELRIGRKYLEGIERGDYEGWPERVFSSGFIRTYARYLSESPGPVLTEYERSVRQNAEGETAAQLRPEWLERERERGNRRTTYTLAAGAVLLLGIVLSWVSLRGRNLPPPPPPAAPAVSAIAVPDNAGISRDNAAAPGTPDNVVPASQAAPPSSTPPSVSPAAAPPTVSTVGGQGVPSGPFQLFLEASEQTWVMYSFDDGDPIDATLYAGDKISIQAKKRISLKLGNAGGVVGTLNGKRLPPFGERGQVRRFTLGE
ncbi:MAG: helix-turn-helix domain-containing protein [Deltaproteobacteria bacterium]|nr:helix-turn-helix domain-containing protein [Deltaproteobacteria bacterium]